MNSYTNKFECFIDNIKESPGPRDQDELKRIFSGAPPALLRPDGSFIPDHQVRFKLDEHVFIKNCAFRVAYIGETSILLEPVEMAELLGAERE